MLDIHIYSYEYVQFDVKIGKARIQYSMSYGQDTSALQWKTNEMKYTMNEIGLREIKPVDFVIYILLCSSIFLSHYEFEL